MKSIIFAWVLIVWPGFNSAYTISNIRTEQECERLGAKLAGSSLFAGKNYQCERYEVATP